MDYNWLLSTSAQSAAAIVAIVAGFVLSRVLALSAERNGLESRLKETERNLSFNTGEAEEFEAARIDWEADSFLTSVRGRMVEAHGDASLEDLIEEEGCALSREELLPYFEREVEIIKRAFTFFKNHPFKSGPPQTVGAYLDEINEKVSRNELAIFSEVFQILKRQRQKTNAGLDKIFGYSSFDYGDLLSNITPASVSIANVNRYNEIVKERDSYRTNARLLQKQVQELQERLKYLGKPKGLWWGVCALVYFSVSGIVLPIVWLPVTSLQFSSANRWIVVTGFVSGLLFVMIYLIWSVWHLSRK